MKLMRFLLVLFLSINAALAAPTKSEQEFLKVKGESKSFLDQQKIHRPIPDLPREALLVSNVFSGTEDKVARGFFWDLNNDGVDEIFVEYTSEMTGALGYKILYKVGNKWKILLARENDYHLIKNNKGWSELVITGFGVECGDFNYYWKNHYIFRNNGYIQSWGESLQGGKVVKSVGTQD